MATEQMAVEKHQNHADIVIQVAFQPTARGGSRHFASGNGRIVCHARRLLDDKNPDSHAMYIAHKVEAEGSPEFSLENAWTEIMEEQMGLRKDDRGKDDQEQLIIHNEQMFTCPLCENMVL